MEQKSKEPMPSAVPTDRLPDPDPFGALLPSTPFRGSGHGALAGLRLCVKDNVSVAGQPLTAGHPLFAERTARETAPAVASLLDAGADFVGMSVTDAGGFGMTTDAVINPRCPDRTVGGSSGGAAAAVAAGLADLAVGTDTGGSVRVPAACTDLFGFKPSRGRVSLDGIVPLAPSFDHPGLMARTFDDLARAAGVWLAGLEAQAERGTPLSVAVESRAPTFMDPHVRVRFEGALSRLRDAGISITHVSLPDREALVADFGAKVVREAIPLYATLSAQERLCLGAAARKALALPPQTPEAGAAGEARLAAARAAYGACLERFDLIVSPTLFIPPPPRETHVMEIAGRRRGVLAMLLAGTCFCNLTGDPALTLPLPGGALPFGLHLAGRLGGDEALLRSARRILDVCAQGVS